MLTSLQFGRYICSVDNKTWSKTNVCTDIVSGISTARIDPRGSFHVETQEKPLIDHWPGIAQCAGKPHGDGCWDKWDV